MPIKNDINQDSLMLKNTVKFAMLSFNLEKDRENSIKEYSNQIIFSCVAISLIVILEYYITGSMTLWSILFINTMSISLAVLSQWRFKYETMVTGEEFELAFCTNRKDYLGQSDYDYQMVYQLTRIQNSKKENNNKRVFLVKIAAGCLLLSIWILGIINIFAVVK